MRIVFMGTPDFAVPSLERLIQAGHTVCGVFCQPDKPVGRHQNKLQAPPVKQAALEHGIPVFQPTKLRDGASWRFSCSIRGSTPPCITVWPTGYTVITGSFWPGLSPSGAGSGLASRSPPARRSAAGW